MTILREGWEPLHTPKSSAHRSVPALAVKFPSLPHCIYSGLIIALKKPLSQHSWKFVDTAEAWPHLPPSLPPCLTLPQPHLCSPPSGAFVPSPSLTPSPYSHHSPQLCVCLPLESLPLLLTRMLLPAYKTGHFLREDCPTAYIKCH